MIKFPKRMPNLEAALNLTAERGLCFHRAAGLVLDLPPATLVVGTLPAATLPQQFDNPEFSSVDFLHAWVEVGDILLAPTLFERAERGETSWVVPRDAYYEVNCPRDIHRMTRARLKKLSTEFGLSAHLRNFTPLKHGAKFGDVILNDMGIKFVVSIHGGVLPAPRRGNESVSLS